MPQIEYVMKLPVRRYEVDRFGFVHTYVYQQYLEEAAIQASTAAGFGPQWYEERGSVWVVREMTLEYLQPASMDDELEIRTWVADLHRVRSHREYEIYRRADRRLLVRADCDWVYIDRKTLWPIRIPAEAIDLLLPSSGRYAVPPARPVPPLPAGWQAPEAVTRRRVQRHEVDGMAHVNNAVYATWFEQAVLDAVEAWLPPDADRWLCWRRHQIEYVSAILPGEEVEVITQLVGMRRARAEWYQEVRRTGSDQAAIRDRSVVLYMDMQRRIQPWPRVR